MATYPYWTARAAWPHRYEVRFLVGDEDPSTVAYQVSTQLGEAKAVAMASALHASRAGTHDGIHDVAVEPLGPVAAGGDGRPERLPGHLVDHLELRA